MEGRPVTRSNLEVPKFILTNHSIIDVCPHVSFVYAIFLSSESSGLVIALLSPTYVASKVCQEEYNLAFAMHNDPGYETKLFPIIVETVENLPTWCSGISPADCRNVSDRGLGDVLQKIDMLQSRCYYVILIAFHEM